MSLAATMWAWRQRVGNPTEKAVLIALADWANDANQAWPSQGTLSDQTEFSQRAVREALRQLELKGYIARQKRGSRRQGRTSDRIRLAVGEKVGLEVYRQQVPPNDLPAPPADLAAARAGEPTKTLYPIQGEDIPPYLVAKTLGADQGFDDFDGGPF